MVRRAGGDVALRDRRSFRGIHPHTTGAGARARVVIKKSTLDEPQQQQQKCRARIFPHLGALGATATVRACDSPRDARTTPRHHRYNHVNVMVKYHEIDVDTYRVVGFYVEPFSIKHEFGSGKTWDPKVFIREKERAAVVGRTAEKQRGKELAAAV